MKRLSERTYNPDVIFSKNISYIDQLKQVTRYLTRDYGHFFVTSHDTKVTIVKLLTRYRLDFYQGTI